MAHVAHIHFDGVKPVFSEEEEEDTEEEEEDLEGE